MHIGKKRKRSLKAKSFFKRYHYRYIHKSLPVAVFFYGNGKPKMVKWFTMMDLLSLPLNELVTEADRIRRSFMANRVEKCAILNAKSGLCAEDCKFCAQSARHSAAISTHSLKSRKEIVDAARGAKEIGAERYGIVTSGNRLTPGELKTIVAAISEIKESVGIRTCASLGTLDNMQLTTLKDAGLERYHHNIETSERFYPRIVTTHTFKERIDTIMAAKAVSLEVCSGGIIGMGESWQDRIEMARLLKELNVDSVPINILVPVKGTPLESIELISPGDAVRTIAIFRIILKDKTIKIAAGREAVLKDSQILGFQAGANGMLIGGYLTVKGDSIKSDRELIREIERSWRE